MYDTRCENSTNLGKVGHKGERNNTGFIKHWKVECIYEGHENKEI